MTAERLSVGRNLLALTCFTFIARGMHAQASPAGTPPASLVWKLERDWSVGGTDDERLPLATLRQKDIAVDSLNRLLVLNRTHNVVAVYGPDGKWLANWGREGAGPGEFSFPRSISTGPDGTVHVEDTNKARDVILSLQGALVRERELVPGRAAGEFRIQRNGGVIGIASTRRQVALVREHGTRFDTLLVLPRSTTRVTEPVCSTTGYPVYKVFEPQLLWTLLPDGIAVNTGTNEISLVGERGDTVATLKARESQKRATAQLARQFLGEGIRIQVQGMPACTVPTEAILKVAEVGDLVPTYSGLAADREGVIWATRTAIPKQASAVADLFHRERGFLGSVALGAARPAAFLRDGRVISIEADANDVPVIVVYRVVR